MKNEYSDGIFCVSSQHGFLPLFTPLPKLPSQYEPVQSLIDQLDNYLLKDAGRIELAIENLPNLLSLVKDEENKQNLQALYRAYTFLASGYLLAPAHFNKNDTSLPKQLAQPLVEVSRKLDVAPWLDYHYSYSLGNYVKKDINGTLHWDNLKMACSFTGTQDEVGFIMNHVYINEVSPNLVKGIFGALKGENVKESLELVLETIRDMNERRRTMWKASNPKNYNDFRAFIMGIEGNDEIFGEGVAYEGCGEELRKYRGQTGAQDDIIPSLDIFTGIINYYPENNLTKYLLDLRNYRPKCVQEYFKDLQKEAPMFLEKLGQEELILLLGIVEQVYYFRAYHMQFVVFYILKNTKYAKATGGTPIISWIPNQIGAVLSYMKELINMIGENNDLRYNKIRNGIDEKIQLLDKQINELRIKNYNIEKLCDMYGNLDDRTHKF